MVRSFLRDPVDPESLGLILEAGRRAPTAGNVQARDFLVLEGVETAGYWDITLPEPKRSGFVWPGLLDAPVLVVVVVDPDGYVDRYAEPDKVHKGLGEGIGEWSVPFWFVDGGAAAQSMLLAAVAENLGACLFGLFDNEVDVLTHYGVPAGRRGVCTVAIGHASGDEKKSNSLRRPVRGVDAVVHRGRW